MSLAATTVLLPRIGSSFLVLLSPALHFSRTDALDKTEERSQAAGNGFESDSLPLLELHCQDIRGDFIRHLSATI